MIQIDTFMQGEGVPIYQQIIRYVKQGIAAGTIRDGEELPSRRALSALLTVNPNTIQKAYRLLEEEGLVQSHAGAKSYVRATEQQRQALRRDFPCTTLVIISERVSAVREADCVLVLENGRIDAQGCHDALMASCRRYQRMAKLQMGGDVG